MLYLKLDRIHQQLELDGLTGVYNRRHIDGQLEAYIEKAKKSGMNLGIAMVDVDSFKILNDRCGHTVGDEALRQIAQIIQNNMTVSKGDFVARFGGDEFMIVCRNITAELFKDRMETVIELVRHINVGEHPDITLGLSAGCVMLEEYPDFTVNDFIKCADQRLYAAKESGRNRVIAG